MSTQKRAFEIHKPVRFGKYSSLSVAQIYSGTGELPAAYCKSYLLKALKLFKPMEEDYNTFFKVEIINNLLKNSVNPETQYYKGIHFSQFDFCREVNNALREYEFGFPFDWYNGYKLEDYTSFSHSRDEERGEREDLIVFVDDEDNTHYMLRYGKPEYVSWLISNVDFFSLAPADLNALEQLDALEFYGIYLKKIEQGVYSINQSFLKLKRKFSDHIKILNEKKWNAFLEKREQTSEVEPYESRGNSWSSRNRDFSSDDDEDQIMRALMNGDSDLFGF